HSVQLPGGQGDRSGGDSAMAHVLARSAVAAGVDGIFLEVHDEPEKALCDGPNMIRLDMLEDLLKTILAIHDIVRQ
ncbi:MAG: 3-deoxy-8-phosphooctulonate synthase, partial [Planctomycetes bacterium]|nr:3-deoxy-8-phosphooctulonate synthase [Planctomycetota bacterium]